MEQKPLEIKKGIYWVGVVDWNVRTFHGHTYTTSRGTTYNAYLIVDEKITLIDTVFGPFTAELITKIKAIVDPSRIEYIIANHVETDHSGALPEIIRLCPKAKVLGTAKCKEGLYRNYYCDFNFQIVKSGETIPLGTKTLSFIEAPMIHWPDSMFTYCPEEKLLMPNDAFGQHYASSGRFDDTVEEYVLMDEARKYYANILWPLSPVILRKIQDIQKMNIALDMIAPSHGIIWRKDPFKIINSYVRWAQNETKPDVVVVYETMWGATEKMARRIVSGLIDSGIRVSVYDVAVHDRTEIIGAMLEAQGFICGSSTHDNDMLPVMAGFLDFLKGLKPKNRICSVFGSYGWGGGAAAEMEKVLKEAGIEIVQTSLGCKYMPDEEDISRSYDFGKEFAGKIHAAGK